MCWMSVIVDLSSGPNDPHKQRGLALEAGTQFEVNRVELSDDAARAVGQLESGLWVNLRSRLNAEGLLRPTYYVHNVRPSQWVVV